ncbi:leucine-rich repeat domain-containing protein [Neobacillus sp. FSL H8-0543]|uniref:leucine-rich repeat domain-containing protein n=1 Tax=Neobacillus sp. FSL H8-0543 TaxID=2954672 RepID=UPI0031598088
MRNRKGIHFSIVLVLLFSLFSPFASLKTYAALGLDLLDVTEKQNSTVLVWQVANDEGEELTNYELIKNGEAVNIEPVLLNESAEDNVRRYSYEDQDVERNTLYTYEIAAYPSTGEKVVSAPMEHTFVGQANDVQINTAEATDADVVTTNIKVVTDQGNIPLDFVFFIEGVNEEGSEVSYYGYLDEEGFFVNSESESRDIELPAGTYSLFTENYSTGEEIRVDFTIESGKDYVTNPIEIVLPDDQMVLKKMIQIEGTTDQSISIGWDGPYDSKGVKKYLVYLNGEFVDEITDPYTTTYTFSELSPETLYQVRVDYFYKDGTTESVSADVTTSAIPTGEVVTFADENLKNAIKNQLKINHRDLYTDDMEKLTSLDASFAEITDLSGLELAVNLVELMLYGNQIEDLSPLANLTNLVHLDLDENLVTSLDDLRMLVNLENLFLAFNQVEDIQVLTELPKLTYVTLYGNDGLDFSKGSEDFEVLKDLIEAGVTVDWGSETYEIFIREVTENSIGVEFSFPGVADLISGYQLYLNGEFVTEIPVGENFYELTGLESLIEYEIRVDAVDEAGFVWGSAYSYVSTLPVPAGEIVQFKDLALEEAVRDSLHIYSRDLYESDMSVLTSLDATDRGIEELDGLELAINLQVLVLDSNSIRNLKPITGLSNLLFLSLSDNQLSDISGLGALTNLESLILDDNEIKDIRILSSFSKLMMLFLQGNKIEDITPLTGLNIEFLNIGFNEIEDISSLLTLENLQVVLLMKNRLDLTEGSEALSVIEKLEANGVTVMYEYLDISVDQVTENSIELSWEPVTKDGYEDYRYFIIVDGEEVATDLEESSYILTDLSPDTEYKIEIVGLNEEFERVIYGTTVVTTAAGEDEPGDGTDESGEGTDPVGEDKTPDGQVTENGSTPDKNEGQKPGSSLPNTATNSYNLLVIGFGIVAAGIIFFVVKRRKLGK